MSLLETVKTNLVHYNLWTSVTEHDNLNLLSGNPPSKLSIDDAENTVEWVIPKLMKDKRLSIGEIEKWFKSVESLTSTRPKRLTIGLVNDDATVVYYFIHDGIVQPRQN